VAAQVFDVEIVPAGHIEHDAPAQLVVALNGAELPLLISPSLLRRLARSFFELPAGCDVPDSLVAAALEASAGPWIERLEKAAGIALEVRRLEPVAPSPEAPALSFSLPGLPEAGGVSVVALPGLSLLSLPPVAWTEADWLPIHFALVFADVDVTLAELEALAVGDVILPGATLEDIVIVRLDISPGTTIIARVDGHRMTVENLGKSMSTTSGAAGAATSNKGEGDASNGTPLVPPAAIEDIPVRLVFDFGDLELTLAELRRLVPGQVIDLARPVGHAVRLSVNGRRIGAGEIVEIEGRLGVRVTELLAGGHEPSAS
jgi:type III secretion protein Q